MNENMKIDKKDFEFVQMNEKIFDKKFETKAIGYFGDALRRFSKNKSSIVAFVILVIIILMAIFVPIFSKYDVATVNIAEGYLPPRIPILENFGIADGTKKITGVNVDYLISVKDPKVENLVDNPDNKDPTLDIKNYYFVEYIKGYEKFNDPTKFIEELKNNSYKTTFNDIVTYKVDIKYNVYKALSRPKWMKNQTRKQYLEYQANGVIINKTDEEGNTNEMVIEYTAPAENILKKFCRDNGYSLSTPNLEELYLEQTGKDIRDLYQYDIYIDPLLNPDFEEIYHFFGTDNTGRDMWVRLWQGTRLSLLIGLFVAVVSITVGVIWGSISGYYGGVVDLAMERFTEILTGIPWIVTMTITKMLLFGRISNVLIVAISLVLTSWTGTAAMVRSQMYRYKNREYVLSSRTLGANDVRLIFKHILPNALGTIVTSCILVIPSAIFFESSVAYLGLGIDASTVSIGNLLNLGRDLGIVQYPYLTLFPALLISILMISFNMFGNGLRDALNPSLRGSE